MLVFWIIAFILVLIALALILPVLIRPDHVENFDANAEKNAIFRQQFAELEQDKENGVLEGAQYDAAKSELERRYLEEVVNTEMAVVVSRPDWKLAALLLATLPIAAGLLYYKLGSPISISIPAVSPDITASQPVAEHSAMTSDLEPLLESLKKKLEMNPADGAGWALLARSYVELRQHDKSISAYENAVKVISDDPQLLADYADALAVVNGHQLSGKPEALVNQALKLDPHHVKSLMLAATAAFNRKDYHQAISFWERLEQDLPTDSEVLPEVKASLSEARVLSGEKAVPKSAEKRPITTTGVKGTVTISPAFAEKLDASTTVFIFARNTHGQSMPLAIERTTVGRLPYAYHLDDSKALIPDHKISQASEIVIVARVSKAGDAKQQSGDLQGLSKMIKPDGKIVDIEINQVIP